MAFSAPFFEAAIRFGNRVHFKINETSLSRWS